MRDGDELRELSVLAREGERPLCMLRAVSSGLAVVFLELGLMGLSNEVCDIQYTSNKCVCDPCNMLP